jgi:hypothetical protein
MYAPRACRKSPGRQSSYLTYTSVAPAGPAGSTQPGGSRRDGVDIAQAALELVPFEQHLRAGGTEQPVGRASRIKTWRNDAVLWRKFL